MLKSLVAFLCISFAASAAAKLGETVPQLVKRFGKSYTVEEVELGKTYKFRSANVSVDAVVSDGRSIRETYYSDHPLAANGEPPNDIVRGVLKTNAPKAQWEEIEAAPFSADYAMRSSDGEYVAILSYTGPQPENMIWTITVGLAKSVQAVSATAPSSNSSPSPFVTPSPSASAAQRFDPKAFLADSDFETGLKYYDGVGVEKNLAEAVKWFRKAAEKNYAPAQFSLGLCYYGGKGVPRNYVEAVKWYRKAAEQNYPLAQLPFCPGCPTTVATARAIEVWQFYSR